jgi:diguanylate cyclase
MRWRFPAAHGSWILHPMQIATDREKKLQRHRLRMTLLSVANTSLQSLIIALYAWAGEVPWSLAGQFFLVGNGMSATFALIIWRGWNLRMKDPGMLLAQIAISVLLQLAFLVLAPKLWVLFLIAVLVTYNFAMMSFSGRQFTLAWLLVGAASGLALFAVRGRFEHFGTTDVSIAILWLFFFLCIRQLTAIGTQFSALRTQLSEKNKQLSASLERIQELASHDDLTGALNRRSFIQLLADERARAQRTAQPFCVALLDIDHFKSVNDRFGHLTGDAVLKEFCAVAAASIRVTDRFARYGGEEFVLLLAPTTSRDVARIATERVRQAVEAHGWEHLAPGLKVTMSAGVAEFAADENIEQLMRRADVALYAAKAAGRNRTLMAGEAIDSELPRAAASR